MNLSQLNTVKIQTDADVFQEEGLLQVNVQNYGLACVMIFNGQKRPLPPPYDVDGTPVPVPFIIEDHGRVFDLSMRFEFDGAPGNVLIDFSKPKC